VLGNLGAVLQNNLVYSLGGTTPRGKKIRGSRSSPFELFGLEVINPNPNMELAVSWIGIQDDINRTITVEKAGTDFIPSVFDILFVGFDDSEDIV